MQENGLVDDAPVVGRQPGWAEVWRVGPEEVRDTLAKLGESTKEDQLVMFEPMV
jgi:hypothetical protein